MTTEQTTQTIVSNQIGLEEIFVRAAHNHAPDKPISPEDLADLRQELVPYLSQAMSELGYSLVKTTS